MKHGNRCMATVMMVLFFLNGSAWPFNAELIRQPEPTEKLILANVAGLAVITTWGLVNWDYGERTSHAESEGWFTQHTKQGGADKLGHFYSSYLLSHGISNLCESWGYSQERAALYGSMSSFGLMTFMEFGDSFSRYGFSYEDFVVNTLGCYAGYLLYRYPGVARKIDLRIEYLPDFSDDDILTDYENMKFLLAVKMNGFDGVENPYLKFLEYHIGYYTRGYSSPDKENRRYFYVGLGINLSKAFAEKDHPKVAKIFNYYQAPYTYIPANITLR